MYGVIDKVNTLRYCNFSLHSFAFLATRVQIVFFKEDKTHILCKLLSIKEPQTSFKNKETTGQSYQKI